MSEKSKKNPSILSNSLVDLMISDIFNRHGINETEKKSLSDEQKNMIKNIVDDLSTQVDKFVEGSKPKQPEKNNE